MASSPSSSMQQKHQVFLSFRDEDTRYNLTGHLHAALKRKGIAYFIDCQLLKGGEEISPAVLTAIEESMISIIVFSKNYASSSWCLEELCKILECKKRNGQMVVPIFYHVDPSDVRKQTGSFAEAFAEHVKKRPDKVEKWRAALKELANISGWHFNAQKDRCGSELIEGIVDEISKKLSHKSFNDFKGCLVGIDSHIKQIESLLRFGSKDVRVIGIWGMGGIGKTTIAEATYHQISNEFEGRYILTNAREKSRRYGWIHLRDELLRNILEEKNLTIGTHLLPSFIHDRLCRKRVFIVLDDVNDSMQLDLLLPCFGPGSRIVVTSRGKQVLQHVVDEIYEVKGLSNDEALQLFCLYAFKQSHPREDFMELSKKVVCYAEGVPLALKVMGSALYGKPKLYWECYTEKVKDISNNRIDDILRISFDGLHDELKDLFLDIACFFTWNARDYVENILDGCYISVTSGISILIDKSLITISHNIIEMHDLVRQMGRSIVRHESQQPGRRSRLWTPNEIYHVLTKNTGTEMVEGILLDMFKIRKLCMSSTVFARMYNLKFLKLYYAHLGRNMERKVYLSQQDLKSLPNTLHLLHWDGYPSKSLPSNFYPSNLVELRMRNSHIKRLWNGVLNLVKLKRLDLNGSRHLTKIPDMSRSTDLESINLHGCKSLFEVPSSIKCLSKLQYLNLEDCRRIKRLPSMKQLLKLRSLDLNHCCWLRSLPKLPPNLEYLKARDCRSLEAVSSSFTICPMSYDQRGRGYDFTNCINLDQNTIWAKTQLEIQQGAAKDAKLYHKNKDQFEGSSLSIWLPGSEIPKWFSCQNEGSSVTIQLPPHSHDHKFVGFALCTVLASNDDLKDLFPSFFVKCQYNLKTNGDFFHKFYESYSLPNVIGLDHVYVNCDFNLYRRYYEEIGYHLNEASFEFSVHPKLDFVVIKKCGVCAIYTQDDLTEFPDRPYENCNPLMIQPSSPYDPIVEEGTTSKRPRDDYCNNEAKRSGDFSSDEEQEPHPKRLK